MTKQEIKEKIEELKKKRDEANFDAKIKEVFQLAFKLILNSVYGFTGTKYSPVFSKDLAESVTLTGQSTIKEMVRFTNKCLNVIGGVKEDEKAEDWVIAGDTDSVFGDAKINFNGKEIEIARAFEIVAERGEVEKLENGTEVAIPNHSYSTDAENGKCCIKNISRHQVKKKMYSVEIPGHDKLVMTEDHSLIVERDGKLVECKPSEVRDTDFLVVKN